MSTEKVDQENNPGTTRTTNQQARLVLYHFSAHCPPPLASRSRIQNPLYGITKDALMAQVEAFVREQGLEEDESTFKKGALLAQKPQEFESMLELDEADKEIIRRETTRSYTFLHYLSIHIYPVSQINGGNLKPYT
jgi:hypothetical protein